MAVCAGIYDQAESYLMDEMIREAVAFIRRHDAFFITYHINPDDDAYGSAVALALSLRSIGKVAEVSGAYPATRTLHTFRYGEMPAGAASIFLDVGSARRGDPIAINGVEIMNIDHHHGSFIEGAVNIVDEWASSTAEILVRIFNAMGVAVSPWVADFLYAGIYSDTDGFRSITTSPETLRAATALAYAGANVQRIASKVQNHTMDFYRLMDSLLIRDDGEIGIYALSYEDASRSNITENELQSLPDRIYEAVGKQTVILLNEIEPNVVRVSIRSIFDQQRFAEAIGGGGRAGAWAVTCRRSLSEVKRIIDDNRGEIAV